MQAWEMRRPWSCARVDHIWSRQNDSLSDPSPPHLHLEREPFNHTLMDLMTRLSVIPQTGRSGHSPADLVGPITLMAVTSNALSLIKWTKLPLCIFPGSSSRIVYEEEWIRQKRSLSSPPIDRGGFSSRRHAKSLSCFLAEVISYHTLDSYTNPEGLTVDAIQGKMLFLCTVL